MFHREKQGIHIAAALFILAVWAAAAVGGQAQPGPAFGPTPSWLDLDNLSSADGIRIEGESHAYNTGVSVSAAGDVNGDGVDDVVIGAAWGNLGAIDPGNAYVVYGKADGLDHIDLDSLAPGDGFILRGAFPGDLFGYNVSGAGDVNGDGIDDLIISAEWGDYHDVDSGEIYIIYGRDGLRGELNMGDLLAEDGFMVFGAEPYGDLGTSVSGGGDVNGDGLGDMIISALPPHGTYVVYGKDGGSSDVDINRLSPDIGFEIEGCSWDVSNAGDVNKDGIDDLMVFCRDAVIIHYGKHGGGLGDEGFRINGIGGVDSWGTGAGDINGDGYGDLILAWYDNGVTYVVYGGGNSDDVALSDLSSDEGFKIYSEPMIRTFSIYQNVSGAGDINGDGLDDIIIGASGDIDWSNLHKNEGGDGSGEVYVIYGNRNRSNDIVLNRLQVRDGFRLEGAGPQNRFGYSVSEAGDVNGDGVDDMIIGAIGLTPHFGRTYRPTFSFGQLSQPGRVYVIFGRRRMP